MTVDQNYVADLYRRLLFGNKIFASDIDPELWDFLRRRLPADRGAEILDAGCGNGRFLRALENAGYAQTIGLDLFPENPGIRRYVRGSLDRLPFADERFDFIVSNSVIYYLNRPAAAFEEMFRVLKPGGRFFITAHTKYSLFTLARIFRRALRLSSAAHLQGVKFRSSLHYRRLAENAGLKVEEMDGWRASYSADFLKKASRKLCGYVPAAPKPREHRRLAWWGLIRSLIAYHAVLTGRKPDASENFPSVGFP